MLAKIAAMTPKQKAIAGSAVAAASLFMLLLCIISAIVGGSMLRGKTGDVAKGIIGSKHLAPDQVADLDGMKFELLEGKIGILRMVDIAKQEYDTDKEYVMIKFKATNSNKNYVWDYHRSHTSFDMSDEFGNKYKSYTELKLLAKENRAGDHAKGGRYPFPQQERIDFGGSVTDAVVFDLPIKTAQFIILDIHGYYFGKDQLSVSFKISREWFK